MENPYELFNNYILRAPIMSLSNYKEITSKKKLQDEDYITLCKNPVFMEALFLASPNFYGEVVKWFEEHETSRGSSEKLKLSLLKYFSRMSSRCTPFGLFSGCCLGKFNTTTNIQLKDNTEHYRHTRLDMNYLVALSQDLSKIETIKNEILFFPNNSIYKVGDKLRYVEYYYKDSKRHHDIVSVDWSQYLQDVLNEATNGSKLNTLVSLLTDQGISAEAASSFVEELILSQLLVNELEPSVSGPEFLGQILSVLQNISKAKEMYLILKDADDRINKIDSLIGNSPREYMDVIERLKPLGTEHNIQFMFQTDLILKEKKNLLSRDILNNLKTGFSFLNQITLPKTTTFLTKFKEAFYERFEDQEVPLSKVLDIEMGIGYRQGEDSGDVNPLIDDLDIPRLDKLNYDDIKWTTVNTLLDEKLRKACREHSYSIILLDEDFANLRTSWDDLPDTMSSIIEIVWVDGEEKIKFTGARGSSASNLLGRFCHGDTTIHSYTEEIIDFETQINGDKILAEIVHLPEARVGNILMRPDFRKYEIPYLAKSIKHLDYQLPLDDLMVSVKGGRKILIRSKKYNKEIVPRLTNAHFFSNGSLPIYHFLCDMQSQDLREGIEFSFGPLAKNYEFLPRVEYKNLILHTALWNLRKKDIKELLKHKNNDDKVSLLLLNLRKKLRIPQFVLLKDWDNELLINLENLTSVRMLLDTVKNRDSFILTEFLFNEINTVKNEKSQYTNQIVVSFYNQDKLKRTITTNGRA